MFLPTIIKPALATPVFGRGLHSEFTQNLGIPAGLWLPWGGWPEGRAYDFSGNGNTGTLNGGITTTPGGFGVLGASWLLSGTATGYATFPGATAPNPSLPFTVILLLKYTSASNLVVFEKNGNSGFSVQIGTGSVGAGHLTMWSGGSTLGPQSASAWNDGKFHLAVFVASATAPKLYVDGADNTATSTASGTPSYGSNTPIYLGGRAGAFNFPGSVALAGIFNGAMTLAQAASLYQSLLTGKPFPLFKPSLTRRYFPVSAGGPQSVTVPPIDVAVSAIAQTVTLGPVTQAAGVANVSVSAIAPAVSLGPVSPAFPTIDVAVSAAAPSISLGPVSPAAGIASIAIDASAPSITLGGSAASVPAITVAVDAVAPNVENGAIFAAAGVASVAVDALPPPISLGPVSITAPVIAVAIDANPPAISLGSVSVAAGLADVLVDVVSPFTQPPQSAAAGILDVAAAVIAPAAGYASYPTIDVWQLDARPTVWILEP